MVFSPTALSGAIFLLQRQLNFLPGIILDHFEFILRNNSVLKVGSYSIICRAPPSVKEEDGAKIPLSLCVNIQF